MLKKIIPLSRLFIRWGTENARTVVKCTLNVSTTMIRSTFGLPFRALNAVTTCEHTFAVRTGKSKLAPGCCVIQKCGAREQIALVISYNTFFSGAEEVHEVLILDGDRPTVWMLFETERDIKWRVCNE